MTVWIGQQFGVFSHTAIAIGGLAAMAIPVAIHLLTRSRQQPQDWGAMRFVIEAYRQRRRSIRLEHWVLLALRCAALGVIGLALAGPVLDGCTSGPAGAFSAPGRLICLVINDSLSTQAVGSDGRQRLAVLRELALSVMDSLEPTDQVALWRAKRPSSQVQVTPTLDHGVVRQAIESMQPGFSRSDLLSALHSVVQTLHERPANHQQVLVVLISDFANGALPIDRSVPPELASMGEAVKWLVIKPSDAVRNVQIASLSPDRQVVFAGQGQAQSTLRLAVHLQRYADELTSESTHIELAVLADHRGEPVYTAGHDYQWPAGEDQITIDMNLPVSVLQERLMGMGWGSTEQDVTLLIRARIEHEPISSTASDALAADNESWAMVRLRSRMTIGLIDDRSSQGSDVSQGFTPQQWLRLALAPLSQTVDTVKAVDLVPTTVAGLDTDSVQALDAVIVLRPDLMNTQGWGALRSLTQQGKLVWVFTPPGDQPTVWGAGLCEQFGLDWRIGVEPQQSNAQAYGWGLATDGPVPQPLNLLAADWEGLLSPVRVTRRLDFSVDPTQADGVWLRTNDGQPILASSRVDDGQVLLLATAVDPIWTNLVTKPLFVPLLHETLRGVLSQLASKDLNPWVCGDQPVLGPRWTGVQQVVNQAHKKVISVTPTNPGGPGDRGSQGLELDQPLSSPGVYTVVPDVLKRPMVVNPDSAGADTRAMDTQQLGQWLTGLGSWQWLTPSNLTDLLAVQRSGVDLGWPMMWVGLALVLTEMVLARWFSHAHRSRRKLRISPQPWGSR